MSPDPADDDELLDSRPAPDLRRWWTLGVLVLVAVIVAAVLVQRGSSSHPAARTTRTPSPSLAEPVIPTLVPGPTANRSALRTPGTCPGIETCRLTTASAATLDAVRAAIRARFGRPSGLRIAALTTAPSSHPGGSVLFSRTISATVAAGTLRILVSSSPDDATTGPALPRSGAILAGDGFVYGYYTHVLLGTPHGAGHVTARLAALDRLANDSRLLTGRG